MTSNVPFGGGECGTRTAYVHGCRCGPCTAAQTAYSRDLRERRRNAALAGGELGYRWRERAACIDRTALMFPERGDDVAIWAALAICARCMVVRECLTYAMGLPTNPPGVWGGTSERQRRKLRRVR